MHPDDNQTNVRREREELGLNDDARPHGQGSKDQGVPAIGQETAPGDRGEHAGGNHREAQIKRFLRARRDPQHLRLDQCQQLPVEDHEPRDE